MLGGFHSIYQLKEVYGITDSLFISISEHIQADTNFIKHININTCSFDELERHPYITSYQAKAIQSFKKLSGAFTSENQLLENYLLPEDTYLKIAPYLTLSN
jgi:DNA uptake protein ComE-like DNA-binding protein